MRRALYIIILALLPMVSYAQSIADLTQKAEIEKNPLHIYSSIGFYHNDLYIVRKDNDKEGTYAYGVVDNDGTVYIPVEYDQIEFEKAGREYKDNIYKCKEKGKWGLVSSTNGTLLPCEYSSLEGNGIWRTCKSGKYGYVQLNGTSSITTLIPCIYESLGKYSADSYIHATLKGKKGMIDSKNKIIIPFEYSNVGTPCHTSNGYSIIWVEKDGKLGIYNDDGKELQPCDIDKAYILTEYNSTELSYTDCPSTDYIYIVRNGLTGLISGSTFETIIPCMYEYLSPIKTSKAFYKANGKWGIIDTNNKTIQLAIYDNVEIDGSTLSEQKMPSMAFQSNMYVRNNGKVGMLKANGEDFIPVKYDSLGMYSDNMLVAKVGDKYGFLNEEGKETVPFVYSQAHNYSEGLAAVVDEHGKFLFIDKLGNVAIKPKKYDRVDDFQNDTCKVYRKDKVREIDREGKKVKDSTKKLEADDTHVGCGNDDMYVENTNYPNDIDTNNTLTPNITPTLSFNDKFFQHQHTRTDNVIQQNERQTKTELKYNEISDLKRQKLNGRIKKIGCDSYNEKEDPNGMGHGEESYEFEYDNNGMLTKYSYEAPYVGDITFHYNNGKLISSSGYLGGSSFLYQKKDKTTVNIIERDKDGEERIVMTLNFYPNGVIKQKRILSSLVDPYNKETVIRYDTNGIEIDDMPSYSEIISEKRDSHNNWTKRIFRDGREVTRDIEYY